MVTIIRMNRIDERFKYLKEKNKKALIPFITAGDPDLEGTIKLVLALEKSGADIVELGIPYSDPIADGEVIQASSSRALKNGAKISKIMDTVAKIRENSQIPLVYLVYYNSIFKYGMEKFIKQCSEVGVDGLIIPDLPIEERKDIIEIADEYNVYLIPLVAPTSKERIKKITEGSKGFVYCVTVKGITGVRQNIDTDIKDYMDLVGSYTDLPKALGFGISSKEMAESFSKCSDGIIIGSALIKRISEGESLEDKLENVSTFVREIKAAL